MPGNFPSNTQWAKRYGELDDDEREQIRGFFNTFWESAGFLLDEYHEGLSYRTVLVHHVVNVHELRRLINKFFIDSDSRERDRTG